MGVLPIDPAISALIEDLRKRIEQLEKELAQKDRIIEEQARIIEEWKQGHRVRPKRRSSASKKKRKNPSGKKKPGRKKGHEAAQRPIPNKIDREEKRTKDECESCHGAKLNPTGKAKEIVVEHVIPARVENEKNVLFEYLCDCCGKIQWSELPPEYGPEPPPGQPLLGPGVLSIALGLRYGMGLSFHRVARYFEDYVGLKISASGIYQMIERAARRTKTAAEEILERALMSLYLNMDETSWWEDGKKLWAWLMANLDLSYFHIEGSRSHEVIEKLLCERDEDGNIVSPYEGTVVSDFMGAYRTCEWMVHQWCWVHLLRDSKKEAELDRCRRTEAFRDRLHEIYRDALDVQLTQDDGKKHGIRVRLGRLVSDADLGAHSEVARLQSRAFKEFHGLLHFLDDPELPAHNNQGELDIRSLVLFRKVIFGTRSERGTEVHAHFMSLSQTAKKQGIDLGEFVIQSIAAHQSGTSPPSIFSS